MSSNDFLVFDLLNQAKVAKDAQAKIFNLEQVKEIVLYREPMLLRQVLPEVIDFMVERTVSIRRFIIQFACAALLRDSLVAPSVVSLFSFLVADPQDQLLRTLPVDLAKIYDSLIISIASNPKKGFGGTYTPKDLWAQVRSTTSSLMDMISGLRDSLIRISCLQLAGCIVIFGYPSSSGCNVSNIPLHNANIDRNVIIADAETLLSKLVLWARRGGPQENTFSNTEIIQLGKTLGRIACERPATRPKTVLSLSFLLETTGEIGELIQYAQQVLDIADPPSLLDLENPLFKLKASLQKARDKEESSKMSALSNVDSKKRARSSIEDNAAEDEATENTSVFQQSIQEAVDQAQLSLLQPSSNQNQSKFNLSGQNSFDLASELAAFPYNTQSFKISSVDDVAKHPSAQPSAPSQLIVRVLPPSQIEVYADSSLESLRRVIDELRNAKEGLPARFHICCRLVITLTVAEIYTSRPLSIVPVIASHTVLPSSLVDKIPRQVFLPRPLWVSVSYFLHPQTSSAGKSRPMLDIIHAIVLELYRRGLALSTPVADESPAAIQHGLFLYESLCLALLSRLVQIKDLRMHARDFLLKLPVIPCTCMDLLGAVAVYGSQVSAGSNRGRDHGAGADDRDKGTMVLGLTLLGHLAKSTTVEDGSPSSDTALQAQESALTYLLSAAVSDDFGLRSKAVSQIVEDMVPHSDVRSRRRVWNYALKSAVSILGVEAVLEDDDLKAMEIDGWGERGSGEPVVEAVTKDDHGPPEAVEMEVEEVEEEVIESAPETGNDIADEPHAMQNISIREVALNFDTSDGTHTKFAPIDATVTYSEKDLTRPRTVRTIAKQYLPSVEGNTRRQLHLLCQLSLGCPSLLHSLVDLLTVCSNIGEASSSDAMAPSPDTATSSSDASKQVTTDTNTKSEAPVDPGHREDEQLWQLVARVIRTELLQTLIPALARTVPGAQLFSYFSTVLPVARQLVLSGLDLLLPDFQMPPDEQLVIRVREFIKRFHKYDAFFTAAKSSQISIETDSNSNDPVSSPSESVVVPPAAPQPDLEVRFLSVVVGGLSRDEVRALLPRIVRELGCGGTDSLEFLRKTISRMVLARPPPLSEANLLVELHRVDHTANGMKTKYLLEAIGSCLSNREVFRSETVKEAITTLLGDDTLSLCLMRTVIISAQSYPELKTFGLAEVVPRLVRLCTWERAPRVWEGVAMFIKSFAGHREAEPALRAVLGLPVPQLRAILKVAPTSRAVLSKLLKTFSGDELAEVVSGRWVGLVTDLSVSEEVRVKAELEKMKLIKELQDKPDSAMK